MFSIKKKNHLFKMYIFNSEKNFFLILSLKKTIRNTRRLLNSKAVTYLTRIYSLKSGLIETNPSFFLNEN